MSLEIKNTVQQKVNPHLNQDQGVNSTKTFELPTSQLNRVNDKNTSHILNYSTKEINALANKVSTIIAEQENPIVFKTVSPELSQDYAARVVQLQNLPGYEYLLLNSSGGSGSLQAVDKNLIETKQSITTKAIDLSTTASLNLTSKTGVSISPEMVIRGKIMRQSSSNASLGLKFENTNEIEGGSAFVRVNLKEKYEKASSIEESYSLIASPDRLRSIHHGKATMPDVRNPETLLVNEIVSQNIAYKKEEGLSLKLEAKSFFFKAGASIGVSNSETPWLRRVSVRAALAPNGDRHEVISFSKVTTKENTSKVAFSGGTNEIKLGNSKNSTLRQAQKSIEAEVSGAKETNKGNRSGYFIEIDRKSKEGQAVFDDIIQTGKITKDSLKKECVITAGRFESTSEGNIISIGGKLSGNRVLNANINTTYSYNMRQETLFDIDKSSDNSVMSKTTGIYGATNSGGFQAVNLSKSAKHGYVDKFQSEEAKLILTKSINKKGATLSENTSYFGNKIEPKFIITAIENDIKRIKEGKKPIFREFNVVASNGDILSKEKALVVLKKVQQKNGIVQISATNTKGTDFDKVFTEVGNDIKQYADSRTTYFKVVDHHTTSTADNMEKNIPRVDGINTSYKDSKGVAIDALKENTNYGEILSDLAKYHEDSKRENSYPIIFNIQQPYGDI